MVFKEILSSATGPLVLISGIGIFTLSLNARYQQSLSRIRELYSNKSKWKLETYKKEMALIIRRSHYLKWSLTSLIFSTVTSSFLLIMSIMEELLSTTLPAMKVTFLVMSSIAITISMVLFFLDVLISQKATLIHISDD